MADERCCPPVPQPEASAPCLPPVADLSSPCRDDDCVIAWDGGRSVWDKGATRWPCEEETPEPILILGVGAFYRIFRLNAATGEVLGAPLYGHGVARSYLSSGPGGLETEFYDVGEQALPYWSNHLQRLDGMERTWAYPPGGSADNFGMVTSRPMAGGAERAVNTGGGQLLRMDAATGAVLARAPLAGMNLSRELELAPDEESVFVVRNRTTYRLMRVAWDGTILWQWGLSGFAQAERSYIHHHDGYVYLKLSTSLQRHNAATGEIDPTWSYTQSGMYGLAYGFSGGAQRIFTAASAGVMCVDLLTREVLWHVPGLYANVDELLVGPEGEVYACTRGGPGSDDRMRVYRISAAGVLEWEAVMEVGMQVPDNTAGLALSYGLPPAPEEQT